MIFRLVTILGAVLFIIACSGKGDSSAPPPTPPATTVSGTSCPPTFSATGPNGSINFVGAPPAAAPTGAPIGAPTGQIAGVPGMPGAQCAPAVATVDPQSILDLQSAYSKAQQICCSTAAPYAAAVVATYPNPSPVPPPNTSACDQAVTNAVLLGKTIYAPWGGDSYPPYQQYQQVQAQALANCIGSAAGITSTSDPRVTYLLVQSAPVIQQGAAGPAGYMYAAVSPFAYQAMQQQAMMQPGQGMPFPAPQPFPTPLPIY